jgi:hypothetical protein
MDYRLNDVTWIVLFIYDESTLVLNQVKHLKIALNSQCLYLYEIF